MKVTIPCAKHGNVTALCCGRCLDDMATVLRALLESPIHGTAEWDAAEEEAWEIMAAYDNAQEGTRG